MRLLGIIIFFIGIADTIISASDLDEFFNSLRIMPIVGMLGRKGARILFTVLGVISIIIGIVCIIV